MYPVLLQIGGFSLRSFSVMAMLGYLAACWMIHINRRYAKMNDDQASTLMIIAMAAGIIGARMLYVMIEWNYYRRNLARIIRIDQGGLVFYGGFLLALVSIIVYCRRKKLDVIRVLDVFAPSLALAHAFGRIGCFLNGCCWGAPTEFFLGVTYPEGSAPAQAFPGSKLHPAQLYEAAENILVCFLYWHLVRRGKRGMACAAYLTVYGICRFVNEFVRADNPHWNGFTPAQWMGFGLIPVGVVLLIYFGTRKNHGSKSA